MTEWFEEWFGEEYLALYPHRDDREAEELVALIRRTIPIQSLTRVLDVACGAGRHARAFAASGLVPIGVDLSRHLLERARASSLPVARADMRALPIRNQSVELAVNLFTSFGYFADDADHQEALCQMIATVRPGGWFVFDFLNAAGVRTSLADRPADSSGSASDKWLHDNGRFVVKMIVGRDGRQFMERVRLFDSQELIAMIQIAGARVVHQFGDYRGGPADATAPRVLLFAQAGL